MNKKEALKIYYDHIEKIKAYDLVLATANFDSSTIAPKKGNAHRNKMMSIVQGEAFPIQTDPVLVEAINYLNGIPLDEKMTREISLAKKNLDEMLCFTKEEVMEYALVQMNANDAWLEAKQKKDYSIFEPHLLKLIELTKQRTLKKKPDAKVYDTLLDDYQEGMNIKKYDAFFKTVKKELVPLIKKISKKQGFIDDSFIYKYYPIEKQERFSEDLNKYLGFDKSWGYMGVSEHPFTNAFSRNDVRITTNYDEHNVIGSIYSIIHETGHAFYEHQLDPAYDKLIELSGMSSGMHESQSRFLENYLGRRKTFFTKLYPKLQKLFPENLGDVSLEDFSRAANVSRCSLIRTDADELTYPIHILIRYEIEKMIFNDEIDLKDLSKIWNQKYKDYLGLDVPDDASGILQDIHWSLAYFGYFPTYALGSAIGAQIFHQMSKELDVDETLAKGDFKILTDYLKNHIQKYGNLYDYDRILQIVTGELFDPHYYTDYLKEKYQKLYEL
ncbi:MAG: carboxypeptidase M32 [Erysipelotrichaceae bacterium]|nr:carboxypeptidase M32 [Erysipelotrichaceae bacterium]